MGVDRPPAVGAQIPGKMIAQPIVDIQVEIKTGARYSIDLTGLKMLDIDQALQCA